MIYTLDTGFYVAPETIDGLGMNVTFDIDIFLVSDFLVLIAHIQEPIINLVLVGIDCSSFLNRLSNNRFDGITFYVRNCNSL